MRGRHPQSKTHDTHDDWCEYAFQLTLAAKALGHEVKALRVDAGSDLGRARTHTVPIEFEISETAYQVLRAPGVPRNAVTVRPHGTS